MGLLEGKVAIVTGAAMGMGEATARVFAAAGAHVLVSDVNEQFLSDLELALERPHTSELVALDDITPSVREIRVQLR